MKEHDQHDSLPTHLGMPISSSIDAEGKVTTQFSVHTGPEAKNMTSEEIRDALAVRHGIHPDTLRVRAVGEKAGRSSVSFSGGWKASNWEPTGPAPNYGYNPSMN